MTIWARYPGKCAKCTEHVTCPERVEVPQATKIFNRGGGNMARREYSEAYILSTPRARREFEGRDEYGRVFGPARDYCPECGAPATDGRGNEAEARSLADIRHWEARLCLLECTKCGTRYHCYG